MLWAVRWGAGSCRIRAPRPGQEAAGLETEHAGVGGARGSGRCDQPCDIDHHVADDVHALGDPLACEVHDRGL